MELSFTDEQRCLIEAPKATYVEACPGAGKTKSIIERFLTQIRAEGRRGVALVSFTNAVVDEARLRCTGQYGALKAPHYVGTIDAFINFFVVGPILRSRTGKKLTFCSIWQHGANSLVTAKSVQGTAQLDWFTFTLNGAATLDRKKVPADRVTLINALQAWQIERLEESAGKMWARHVERGILDARTSRLYLLEFLADAATRSVIMRLLRSRFHEVIVDEVQDCSAEDTALLQLLHESGVRLVLVGDPEQAIFGFRGGSSTELDTVRSLVEIGPRLSGNFRSSPAICKLVDSLRSSSFHDVPMGKYNVETLPIHVLKYVRPSEIAVPAAAVLEANGIACSETVVLAHASSRARAAAGAAASPNTTSTSKLVLLANAVYRAQDKTTPARVRRDALAEIEVHLHALADTENAALTFDEFLAGIGLSHRRYRELALRLVHSLCPPFSGKPSEFKADLAAKAEMQRMMGWSVRGLRKPSVDKWKAPPRAVVERFPFSTVHSYKGLESVAAILVIPERIAGVSDEDDGLTLWSTGAAGEARNVLYVGASRAQRLAILAIHESVSTEVISNLDRDQVPYTLVST